MAPSDRNAMSYHSPEPANCQRCEGRQDSEMASKCEQRDGCHAAASTVRDAVAWRVSIDDLPDEILIQILSHMSFNELVDVIQEVCTRWKRLSQDFKLWTDKEYEFGYREGGDSYSTRRDITDEEAVRIFCAAPNLRKVILARCVPSRIFQALYKNCHWLTELHLHPIQKLRYSVLKNLVKNCPRIRILGIHNGLLKSDKFVEAVSRLYELRVLIVNARLDTVASLRALAAGCPHLAEVDLKHAKVETDDLRDFLTAKRNSLVSLHIDWITVDEKCVTPLLAECANYLQHLELYRFSTVDNVKEEMFTALGQLRNLRELVTAIAYRPPVSAALAFESGRLQNLRRLNLHDGHGVGDDAVIAVSRGCPALRELVLRFCIYLSDAAFCQIHRLKRLEMLDLTYCKCLSGGVFPLLAGLPQLRTLLLEDLNFLKLQPGVAGLLDLAGLHCLSLRGSVVTGVPFHQFPGRLACLRELNIKDCWGDPESTYRLSQEMPDLKIEGSIKADNPVSLTR